MEKICGYADLNGYFHKTEKECKLADNKIKIKKIGNKLDNFSGYLDDILFKNERDLYYTNNTVRSTSIIEKVIHKQVCNVILRDKEDFLLIINEYQNLIDELNYLQSSDLNKWWLKYKWW